MKSPVTQILRTLHERYASLREGDLADYIPELTRADPDWFGICIATRDGHLYEVGDTRQKFTIQSISKALTYGLALEDRGEEHVLSLIGVEPSGDAFNAISLKPGSGAPFNPMINAGAIATCGQILKTDTETRIQRISTARTPRSAPLDPPHPGSPESRGNQLPGPTLADHARRNQAGHHRPTTRYLITSLVL